MVGAKRSDSTTRAWPDSLTIKRGLRGRTKAEVKTRRFAEAGSPSLALADTGLTEQGLWTCYFIEQLHKAVPDDLEAYARSAGFTEKDDLRVALIRELWRARQKQ
jgi:hypothetical protein